MVVRVMPRYGLRRRDYVVRPVSCAVARELIKRYHYAHGAANTAVYTHGLFHRDAPYDCLGVVWWMPPIKAAAVAVGGPEEWRKVLMLSRSCLSPLAPPNAASFLVGASIRRIRAEGRFTRLVTYADEYQARVPAHERIPGVMYRASNAHYDGPTAPRPVWIEAATRRQVCPKRGPRTYSATEMRERGYTLAGRFRKHRYTWTLEQIKRAQMPHAHEWTRKPKQLVLI